MRATWKPHEKHGRLTRQSDLPDSVYAFPKERKEPLTDAKHVRNAVARFDQVTGVPESARELAFAEHQESSKALRYRSVRGKLARLRRSSSAESQAQCAQRRRNAQAYGFGKASRPQGAPQLASAPASRKAPVARLQPRASATRASDLDKYQPAAPLSCELRPQDSLADAVA